MNVKIGNKIRSLRKQKGITQEQLAGSIGISCQAVSKWENNIALPDITLVPSLARFFDVSIDELFDYHLHEKEEKIENICDEAYKYRENDPAMAREIIENGLKSYPDNDILLNNLLYVTNFSKNPDKTIAIASKLISETNNIEVKYDALRFLAYGYNAKGESESAVAALNQIPEFYFTKLSELAFVTTGSVKYEAAEKQKWISFEILLQMMWKLAECYVADGNHTAAVAETKRALTLIDALRDEEKISRFQNYVEYFNKNIPKKTT